MTHKLYSFFKKQKKIIFLTILAIVALAIFIFLPIVLSGHYLFEQNTDFIKSLSTTTPQKIVFVPSYIKTPDVVKGIYMTSWTASNKELRDNLVKMIDDTELNTVVIDIKDYSGKIVFPIEDNPTLKAYGSEEVRVVDLQDFIESLHKKGIYVVGRIAVFQDAYFVKLRPDLAVKNASSTEVWKDHKGISWIDAGSRDYWDYIIMLAKESRKVGFDEINFDYIRYPSDGNMQDISFPQSSTTPKAVTLKNFFSYLHDNLKADANSSGLKISADLFGMTTTATGDMGIGQVLENALPYFDYVDPMVYPSHYPATFMGFDQPEAHPYDVVYYSMQSAVQRAEKMNPISTTVEVINGATTTIAHTEDLNYKSKLRPWLQDFGLKMDYGPDEVKAQIKATNDDELSSWILWSASNKYTKGALEAEQ